MSKYEKYDHHGKQVFVRSDLKGKHREHCLCYNCKLFNIEDREKNCPIANVIYKFCVNFDMVTPVWECGSFEEKND